MFRNRGQGGRGSRPPVRRIRRAPVTPAADRAIVPLAPAVAIGRHSICGSRSSPAGPLKEARAEAGIAAHRAAITADAKARRFAATAAGLEAATAAVLMAAAAAMVQVAEVVAMLQLRRPILPGRPIVNSTGVRVAKSGRLRPPAAFRAALRGSLASKRYFGAGLQIGL